MSYTPVNTDLAKLFQAKHNTRVLAAKEYEEELRCLTMAQAQHQLQIVQDKIEQDLEWASALEAHIHFKGIAQKVREKENSNPKAGKDER